MEKEEHTHRGGVGCCLRGCPLYRLLPGQLDLPNHRFKCFLCDKVVDIFSQHSYGDYCVCHGCMINAVTKTCEAKGPAPERIKPRERSQELQGR